MRSGRLDGSLVASTPCCYYTLSELLIKITGYTQYSGILSEKGVTHTAFSIPSEIRQQVQYRMNLLNMICNRYDFS